MLSPAQHLTKSSFLAGRQCARRLWLSRHQRGLAAPLPDGVPAIRKMGVEIGLRARELFAGGVLVEAGPREHAEAVLETQKLMADPAVTAIFEAGFEHAEVRVRVDVLERLGQDRWGLREVKAASRPKDLYVEDAALQRWVVEGAGAPVASVELIHVNPRYERGDGDIAWERFFSRVDLSDEIDAFSPQLPALVDAYRDVLLAAEAPDVAPSLHCRSRRPCEFWDHCTRDLPADWILRMPRVTRRQYERFVEAGIERVSDIPADFELQPSQRHMREAVRRAVPFVEHGLAEALRGLGPPASYLDFETANPAVPLYAGSRPFENIPFQWSLHRDDGDGELRHFEFLAEAQADPRREFAETLLASLRDRDDPIFVYSPFESRVLENLSMLFVDLGDELRAVRARLVDLLPIVRDRVYHVDFRGSFSIKRIAPALSPGFGYEDLEGIAEGGVAAAAWSELAAGESGPDEVARVRGQLLAYCARDTLALVLVHRALRARVGA